MAAVGVLLLYLIGTFFGIKGLTFIFFTIQKRRGYHPIASTAHAAVTWTEVIVICILSIIFIAFGIASLKDDPHSSLWATPPSRIAIGFFIFVCIVIMISLYITPTLYDGLFAIPPGLTKEKMPNGKIKVTFHDRIPNVWNWYSQHISDEKLQEEKSGE